jgi:putative redox protein
MSDMTAKLVWTGDQTFTATNSAGIETRIDGTHYNAASPVEILLEALGSCTSIDVVIILEKMRTPVLRLEVTLEADRHSPEPRYLTHVRLLFDVWGDGIRNDKLSRAINLSITRYCSVYHSLRKDIVLVAQYRIHPAQAEAAGEYATVNLESEETDSGGT